MPKTYRAYPLTPLGKIAEPAHVLDAGNDEQAVEAARPYVDGHDIEVWHGDKLIQTLRQHVDATSATPTSDAPTPEQCRTKAAELMKVADETTEPAAAADLRREAEVWLRRADAIEATASAVTQFGRQPQPD